MRSQRERCDTLSSLATQTQSSIVTYIMVYDESRIRASDMVDVATGIDAGMTLV